MSDWDSSETCADPEAAELASRISAAWSEAWGRIHEVYDEQVVNGASEKDAWRRASDDFYEQQGMEPPKPIRWWQKWV